MGHPKPPFGSNGIDLFGHCLGFRIDAIRRPSASCAGPSCTGNYSQLIIHGMPNWSVHMPKRLAQKVCCSGISTAPFSDKALKILSAFAGSLRPRETEKPCGFL